MAKLFVICGHGDGDCGARGNGYEEAERVRVLGKRIKELGGDSVILGDINRNFYKDNGISSLKISKDYQIIELHMDSAVVTRAKGAHVIRYKGSKADEYDQALAAFFTGLFPGRASKIVFRADLANPARAYYNGYGYRLVECGFISNAGDVEIFNANIDNIAKNVLRCFGINYGESVPQPQPDVTPAPNKGSEKYSTGTPFTCTGLWTQANGGTWYSASALTYGKGDYTIGRVHNGAEHPYEALRNGVVIGFANDKCIDDEPSAPGNSVVQPKPTPSQGTEKYSTGTPFTCTGLWTQANGGKWYPASSLTYGKGDYKIGKVYKGAQHPYEALRNGSVIGFANDKCIDDEPSAPRNS